jgi:FdhD protein
MKIHQYQGKKFCKNDSYLVEDNLTVEEGLQIYINKKTFSITMRTPGDDEDLVRGLLYAEDIYRGKQVLSVILEKDEKNAVSKAFVEIDESQLGNGYKNSRNLLSVSSCGICGRQELLELSSGKKIEKQEQIIAIKDLYTMFDIMKKGQPTFHQSGGSHAAAAFAKDSTLLSLKEDVGRHNAVDKVVGNLVATNQLKQAKCMVVSGRISYEIVAKAYAAKIPVLGAVSAPSSLAVDFAKELGITLLGFCRENKATCYAHPQRIKE